LGSDRLEAYPTSPINTFETYWHYCEDYLLSFPYPSKNKLREPIKPAQTSLNKLLYVSGQSFPTLVDNIIHRFAASLW
jgi:hypothetical protein